MILKLNHLEIPNHNPPQADQIPKNASLFWCLVLVVWCLKCYLEMYTYFFYLDSHIMFLNIKGLHQTNLPDSFSLFPVLRYYLHKPARRKFVYLSLWLSMLQEFSRNYCYPYFSYSNM